MKPFFKPIPLVLFVFSIWITVVCASLLTFDDSGNLITHSYSIWGDWSAHFTFITALKERGFSWIAGDNPLFPGIPFQYPFLSHVLTYLFSVVTPFDVIHATYISSLILIFILPFVLFQFLKRLQLSDFASFCSVLAFLLIGGVQWLDSSLNAREPLTNQFTEGSFFTQFILFEFFPQRAFLFGLIALCGLSILAFKTKKWTVKRALFLGLGLSLLSLLHVHTWLAMGTLLLSLFIFPAEKILPKLDRKKILFFGGSVAFISAFFLAFLLLRGNAHASQSSWQLWLPFWAQNAKAGGAKAQEMNLFWFWIFNTGLFLPLSAFGIYFARKRKELWAFALAGSLLFGVALFFNIQPYYYDNLKLFTYSFFFLCPFVGIALDEIARLKKLPKYVGMALALILLGFQITSATLDLESFRNGLQNTLFFSKSEFELAEKFKELRVSASSIVLIDPKHNHWVPCLTGNPVAMGYEGWLWSWGVNYATRKVEIAEILLGRPRALEMVKNLAISYIVVQAQEQIENQAINFSFLDANFKKIFAGSGWTIYSSMDVSKSPSVSVR